MQYNIFYISKINKTDHVSTTTVLLWCWQVEQRIKLKSSRQTTQDAWRRYNPVILRVRITIPWIHLHVNDISFIILAGSKDSVSLNLCTPHTLHLSPCADKWQTSMVENYPGKHSEMFLNDINGCQPDCRLNLWNRFELDLGSSPRWAPSSCRSFSSLIKPPLIPVSCISTNPLGLIIWFSVTQIFSLLKVFFFSHRSQSVSH